MLIILGSRNILSILKNVLCKAKMHSTKAWGMHMFLHLIKIFCYKVYQLILMSLKIFTKPFTKQIVLFTFDKMKFEKWTDFDLELVRLRAWT